MEDQQENKPENDMKTGMLYQFNVKGLGEELGRARKAWKGFAQAGCGSQPSVSVIARAIVMVIVIIITIIISIVSLRVSVIVRIELRIWGGGLGSVSCGFPEVVD